MERFELATTETQWTSDIAKELFDRLHADAKDVAVKLGLAMPPEPAMTATELRPLYALPAPRDAVEYSKRVHEYDEAVKPIRAHMVDLYSRFTRPVAHFTTAPE